MPLCSLNNKGQTIGKGLKYAWGGKVQPAFDCTKDSMRNKPYVGCKAGKREVFKSETTPTESSHGHLYNAVIGPFRTMRGARFMAQCGGNNPHVQCVADAERIAAL